MQQTFRPYQHYHFFEHDDTSIIVLSDTPERPYRSEVKDLPFADNGYYYVKHLPLEGLTDNMMEVFTHLQKELFEKDPVAFFEKGNRLVFNEKEPEPPEFDPFTYDVEMDCDIHDNEEYFSYMAQKKAKDDRAAIERKFMGYIKAGDFGQESETVQAFLACFNGGGEIFTLSSNWVASYLDFMNGFSLVVNDERGKDWASFFLEKIGRYILFADISNEKRKLLASQFMTIPQHGNKDKPVDLYEILDGADIKLVSTKNEIERILSFFKDNGFDIQEYDNGEVFKGEYIKVCIISGEIKSKDGREIELETDITYYCPVSHEKMVGGRIYDLWMRASNEGREKTMEIYPMKDLMFDVGYPALTLGYFEQVVGKIRESTLEELMQWPSACFCDVEDEEDF